jgi:hypothetical protein
MSNLRSLRENEPLQDADPSAGDRWTHLAETYWLKSSKSNKIIPDVLKTEIWDVLQNDGFEYKSLLALENLQLLEKYRSSSNLSTGTYVEFYIDTCGQHTVTTRQIITFFSSC